MTRHYPLDQWPKLYLDFVNNFSTIERFAEYYNMDEDHAQDILEIGRATDNFTKAIRWEELKLPCVLCNDRARATGSNACRSCLDRYPL